MESSNSEIFVSSPITWSAELSDIQLLSQHDHVSVYRARQFGHWYIYKAVADNHPDALLRLQQEFAIGLKLDHPHIVHTLDYGHHNQLGEYIRLEWIDGTTLTEFLSSSPNRVTREQLVWQLIQALQYMHSLSVVHRDLKPENILVTRNGHQLKLIDLSLASMDNAVTTLPAGTLSYIAPEQLTALQTDIRSDIYSLGKLIRLIAPFYAHTARKCMRSIPDYRYASCGQILTSLRLRQRLRIGLPVALLLLLSLSLSLFLWLRPDPREAVIQQAEQLMNEQYEQICSTPPASPQQLNQTLVLFYERCAVARDSVAATIEDESLRNDFVNAAIISAGRLATVYSETASVVYR